jgi:hypothetical protein
MTEPLFTILPGFPSQSVPYAETLYNVLNLQVCNNFKERSYES